MSDLEPKSVDIKKRILLFLKTIFHGGYWITNLCVSTFGIVMCFTVSDEMLVHEPISNLKWFTSAYGTNWNYLFQTVFLFLALTHDVLEWCDKHNSAFCTKLRYWRDVIFSGLVVPYTCFVFTMFWSLYSIDRDLVFPKIYDEVIPWWFNHCVHTNILVMMLVETVLQPRRHPTDKRLELILNGAVGILYAIVYYSIYFFAHRWLYNVFGILNWWQVCIFQCGIWLSSYIFYQLQFPINRLIHRETEEEEKSVQNQSTKNGEVQTTEEKQIEEFKDSPFSSKSWSLKYRTARDQTEHSSL